MKVLIIEDEQPGAERLAHQLQAIDNTIEILGILPDTGTAIDWFRNHEHPDIVFMDIELSDGQCFRIFQETEVRSSIIFTTSYDEYALKAFEQNSIDYLLKPIKKERLELGLQKYKQLQQRFAYDNTWMEALLNKVAPPPSWRDKFLVKHGQRYISVTTDEIAYFYSDLRLVFLVTTNKDKYMVDYKLEDLEKMLDPAMFYRANRSFIVHTRSVAGIITGKNLKLSVTLEPAPGGPITISREKARAFKTWMGR
ncbi:LytR/AlgR family response regulator transcription factor [Sediminibacterium ginsengisoli]|uniref:Two component transcriptional regulator, LytTR family n=1 Tax=Sediminibacterium ginsengisoli TaxID=413434 RepID=A0A1T4RGV4_9BACT|nr:LytTR family DNA-binding domain-containing protein [Sediminibacterium ginsengisoli]SKA14881.1 two component transcriptional regulator, LytTR family [Sediminibacterium ginsengisoli]